MMIWVLTSLNWSVDAIILEKLTVSVFRVEVIILLILGRKEIVKLDGVS